MLEQVSAAEFMFVTLLYEPEPPTPVYVMPVTCWQYQLPLSSTLPSEHKSRLSATTTAASSAAAERRYFILTVSDEVCFEMLAFRRRFVWAVFVVCLLFCYTCFPGLSLHHH